MNFLIVVDAYSKWLEVTPMGSMTSLKTIEVFSLVVCTLRNTGRGGFGQWTAASIVRVLSILGAEWSQVYPGSTVPSCI